MSEGKRFTNAELAAAYWLMRWVRSTALRFSKVGGPSKRDNERLAAMRRFISLPHYDDPEHYEDEPLKGNLDSEVGSELVPSESLLSDMDYSALKTVMNAMSAKMQEQQAQLDAVRAQVEVWEAQNTEGEDLASHVSREAFRLACLRIRAALKAGG